MTERTDELANLFLEAKANTGRRPNTLRRYRDTLQRFSRLYPVLPLAPLAITDFLGQFKGH